MIWNVLEDLRRRENLRARLRRGEDAADLRQDALGDLGPLGEVPREHVPVRSHERPHVRAQADELPRALLPLRRGAYAATASCRSGSPRPATLHRDELAGTLHGLLRVRHVTQDDAHIFCTPRADRGRGPRLPRLRLPLRPVRARDARRALDPAREQARHRRGVGRRRGGARARRSSGAGSSTRSNEGDGAFYGPKIDLHMTDSLGRSWQIGTVQLDSQMPQRFGLTLRWAPTTPSTRRCVIHRALLGSLERFIGILIEHFARRVPVLARAGAGARDPGRRGAPRAPRASWRAKLAAATASRSTSPTRPSARRSATPSSRRSRSSIVYGDQESRRVARDPRARRRAVDAVAGGASREACYAEPWQAGAEPSLTSGAARLSEVQPSEVERNFGRCVSAVFVVSEGGQRELGDAAFEAAARVLRAAAPPGAAGADQRCDPRPAGPPDRRGRRAARDQETDEAREYAYGKGLDLVEVAAQADPPVAR